MEEKTQYETQQLILPNVFKYGSDFGANKKEEDNQEKNNNVGEIEQINMQGTIITSSQVALTNNVLQTPFHFFNCKIEITRSRQLTNNVFQ